MSSFKIPTHVAIIMDGNGRWAKQRNLPRTEGHKEGVKRVKEIIAYSLEKGIKHLTLYTFSKENWKRPESEIKTLFNLLTNHLKQEESSLLKQGVRLNILGDLTELPFLTRKVVERTIQKTRKCTKLHLNLALNYSGREEILLAVKKILQDQVHPSEINEELFSSYLYTQGQPDPDLLIRTSGEKRLSNFLLFQSAYTELYFTSTLWPDFTSTEMDKALEDFNQRERRFGGL